MRYHVGMTRVLFGLGLLFVLACEDKSEDNAKALDAVTASTVALYEAIDADNAMWLTDTAAGKVVSGTLNGASGTLEAHGWRSNSEVEIPEGFHAAYGERLSLTYNGFALTDVVITGNLVLTRHNVDFGPPGGTDVTEVSRTTLYQGAVLTTGGVAGTFNIDVHGLAAGQIEWACGTINDDDYGRGSCY